MIRNSIKYVLLNAILLLFLLCPIIGQTPFGCTKTVWMLEEGTERLISFSINPSNNAIQITNFILDVEGRIDAIAFNRNDGLLYGLNENSYELYTIDADKQFTLVAQLDLTPGLTYQALTFDETGDRLLAVGSSSGVDRVLEIIDVTNNFQKQSITFTGNIHVTDYALNPQTGFYYGYNIPDDLVIELDLDNLSFRALDAPEPGNGYQGVFTNAFGDIFAFGSTAFSVASALYRINDGEIVETRLATGPESYMRDFASCPFRVDVSLAVDPKFSFPCNEVEYIFHIANGSLRDQNDISLLAELDLGFDFQSVNNFNVSGDFDLNGRFLEIDNLDLQPGIDSFKATVEIADIMAGNYDAVATISGLPSFLGGDVESDNPNTIRQDDKTRIEIKRIDADSIFVSYFFCRDDDPILNGQEFGANLRWENGTTGPTLLVDNSGTYVLEARSGCQSTIVVFEVTIANCPFNIDFDHVMIPDTVYPCSESIFEFIVDNDTGNEYVGIDFLDTLPSGFEVIDLLKNPFDGDFEIDDPRRLSLKDMTIPDGRDTIRFLVSIGDIDPDAYGNQAIIKNFPLNLGSFRESDNPWTIGQDETYMTVLGVESDTTFRDTIVCRGESIVLDGSPFGFDFLWDNGSIEDSREITDPGVYELQVFSGCEVSYVFFNVALGDDIDVAFNPSSFEILLGDSIQAFPEIFSENGIVNIEWFDPQDSTISCVECLSPFMLPYFDNEYLIRVNNDVCEDSAVLEITVDKTRRIFAPNVFNPKLIDANGQFALQSPDFARVLELVVVDRSGRIIYKDGGFAINDPTHYWDGWALNRRAPSGVYMWQCRLQFLDGVEEVFSGSITLLR